MGGPEHENHRLDEYLRVHISAIQVQVVEPLSMNMIALSCSPCKPVSSTYLAEDTIFYEKIIAIYYISIGSPSLKDESSSVYQSDDTEWLAGGLH